MRGGAERAARAAVSPKLTHYGRDMLMPQQNFTWFKHYFVDHDGTACPPWNLTDNTTLGGLFPHPVYPSQLLSQARAPAPAWRARAYAMRPRSLDSDEVHAPPVVYGKLRSENSHEFAGTPASNALQFLQHLLRQAALQLSVSLPTVMLVQRGLRFCVMKQHSACDGAAVSG